MLIVHVVLFPLSRTTTLDTAPAAAAIAYAGRNTNDTTTRLIMKSRPPGTAVIKNPRRSDASSYWKCPSPPPPPPDTTTTAAVTLPYPRPLNTVRAIVANPSLVSRTNDDVKRRFPSVRRARETSVELCEKLQQSLTRINDCPPPVSVAHIS